jgi:hypothetical protein
MGGIAFAATPFLPSNAADRFEGLLKTDQPYKPYNKGCKNARICLVEPNFMGQP